MMVSVRMQLSLHLAGKSWKERIAELEEIRRQELKKEQEKPVQMDIFDFIK